ncbi:MAG TPA: SsrA-binding protein SmpB [Phycisphaerales bacterium]|nr:SsrA-binding protein SmpB [Phycisphaerales bacterium]
MTKKKSSTEPRVIENRRARFDYHILETLEVGIVLAGPEVKSLRAGTVSLGEGYVRATEAPPELTLYGVTISDYQPAGARQPAGTRPRRLLAHKREILKLAKASSAKGATIVPLKLYFNERGMAKLLIGVGVGKAAHDKRQAIAERETRRDIGRAMSRRLG